VSFGHPRRGARGRGVRQSPGASCSSRGSYLITNLELPCPSATAATLPTVVYPPVLPLLLLLLLLLQVAPSLLLVKDGSGCVFGAYVADAWRYNPRFYGTGETFVFQVWSVGGRVVCLGWKARVCMCVCVGGVSTYAVLGNPTLVFRHCVQAK